MLTVSYKLKIELYLMFDEKMHQLSIKTQTCMNIQIFDSLIFLLII